MKNKLEAKNEVEMPEGKYGKYQDYEIESAADTLMKAKEIQEDGEKMKHVKTHMEKKMKNTKKALSEISSIDDLKAIRKEKMEESSSDDE